MDHDQPAAPNRALRWQRVIVWMVPCGLIPALTVFMPVYLHLPKSTAPYLWLAAFAAVIGLGYYDGRLFAQQRRMSPDYAEGAIMSSLIIFFFAQIVIVPVFWGGLLTLFFAVFWHP